MVLADVSAVSGLEEFFAILFSGVELCSVQTIRRVYMCSGETGKISSPRGTDSSGTWDSTTISSQEAVAC